MTDFSDTRQMAITAAVVAEEKKGKDVVIIDFSGKSVLYDYVIITSAMSKTETRAIANAIDMQFKNVETHRRVIQGLDSGFWILLDYGSIVIHVFAEQDRDFAGRGLRPVNRDRVDANYRLFYDLEELGKDVPRLEYAELGETKKIREEYLNRSAEIG